MSSSTPRRRAPRAVLLGLLPLALASGLAVTAKPASASAGDGGEQPPPPIKVTATATATPFYGDPVTVTARAGVDASATVLFGKETLAGPSDMPASFAIPTLGRFLPGTTYTLKVLAEGEISSGSANVSFTPRHIPSQVKVSGLSGGRLVVPYSSPVFGVLDPTITTSVAPSGGTVALERGGTIRTRYAIRTDRTFALNDTSMTPGLYPGVKVYYEGDAAWAPTPYGAGQAALDIQVVKMPTATTSALSATRINRGDAVDVLAATASTWSDTTADVTGRLQVSAAPVGSDDFTAVTEVAYPGGKQQVSIPLQDWARTHPGFWRIRTTNTGTAVSEPSSSETSLQIVEEGTAVEDTSTEIELSGNRGTVLGEGVRATATVASARGAVATGQVAFTVAGHVVATAPLGADGIARATVAPRVVGPQEVTASFLGAGDFLGSTSLAATLTGTKAATTTTITRGSRLGVRVAAVGSGVVPTGTVTMKEGSRVLGSATLARGAASYAVPALRAGRHTLTLSYAGDSRTEASSTSLVVTVAAKARSATRAALRRAPGHRVRAVIRVSSARAVSGTVQVVRRGKVVARGVLRPAAHGRLRLVTTPLPRGTSRLTVRFLGSTTVAPSATKALRFRVR